MSWFTDMEAHVGAFLIRTEAAVQGVVADIVKGEQVVLADLQAAGDWIANHQQAIDAAVTGAAALATGLGVPVSPVVLADVAGAAQSLAAFAAAHNSGQSTPASVVQGYIAYKQATSAISAATASALQAKANATLGAVAKAADTVAAALPGTTIATGAADLAAAVQNAPAPAK